MSRSWAINIERTASRSRYRALVGGLPLLLIAVVGIRLSPQAGEPEPIYRGKTLGAWLEDFDAIGCYAFLSDEAIAAVRAIGPRAIPTLLNWLGQSESPVMRDVKDVTRELSRHLRISLSIPSSQLNRLRASLGFRVLGPVASSAFPAIVAIALNSPDEGQRRDAINALIESDVGAMRLIAKSLESPDRTLRLRAVDAIGYLKIAPDEVCLPALEKALGDPDLMVRIEAAKMVACFEQDLAKYATWLTDRDPKMRLIGARRLGGYRTRAVGSLPDLEAASHDEDPVVRKAVLEAIQEVRGRCLSRAD